MYQLPSTEEIKYSLVKSINQENNFFCLLNSNHYKDSYGKLTWRLSAGSNHLLLNDTQGAFHKLKQFITKKSYAGFLSYDLKNDVEKLSSKHPSFIDFPELFFFEEEIIFDEKSAEINSNQTNYTLGNYVFKGLQKESRLENINHLVSKEEYIDTIKKIQQHIIDGDVYELNYCIPFEISNIDIDPIDLYFELNKKSPNPFSSLLKINEKYIVSASPERFLCKRNNRLISQPIKGTIKRTENIESDKQALLNSEKERAENVMIVDLVRNDLTKSAKTGSIRVDELFGIYTFPQLHQMISTISAELNDDIHIVDAIKAAFPMGSMTGAPKIKAMELIEHYEVFKRGAYSGALGYIDDHMDFDFNVLIRSIFIDTKNKKLCFNVGSAITLDSDPEQEYEECLLKAKAILETLKAR